MYKKPTTLFQKKLSERFAAREDSEMLASVLKLILLKNAEKDESLMRLVELYNMVGIEQFTAIVSLFSGRTVTFPDKDDFKDMLLTGICYYYKNMMGKEWEEIKETLADPNINAVKIGIKINQLSNFLKQSFNEKRDDIVRNMSNE